MTIKERFQKLFKKKASVELGSKREATFEDLPGGYHEKVSELDKLADLEEDFEEDLDLEEELDLLDDSVELAEAIAENDLMLQFEKETGKNAIWGAKKTKGYLKWKENHNS